jgi:carboxyl-terminal processing protease
MNDYFYGVFQANKQIMRQIKIIFLSAILFVCGMQAQEPQASSTEVQAANADNKRDGNNFEVSKQLDIFNALVKEVEMFYVDTVDIQKTVRRGIDAMLKGLDPYTEYISEDEMEQLMFLTTGEYGGIGAYIRTRDGGTVITEPFAGMPAAEAGLKAGDRIVAVDTVDTKQLSSDKVSELLKGVPNTKMAVKIQRPGERKPRKFEIVRKQVIVDQVAHYGVYDDRIGYIYLKGFTDKSAQEVKAAFEDLRKNHQVRSLILDLRDNGGGILEGAVQIVNLFVPKGKEVLTMKGKISQWDRTYRTYSEPVDTVMPLTVLINGSSASASEIVAGALQDMDRAVLVGQRSFGKGLVQSTRNLPYDGKLKVTMSKYYIPSGRCIQQLDYSHRNPDGSVAAIPDSLTSVFYTENGRSVRDGGGIRPDFEVDEEKMPTMLYYLYLDKDYLLFDYVTDWVNKHQTIPPAVEFEYTDADYDLFKKYIREKNFEYDRQSEKALEALREVARFEGFLEDDSTLFVALEEKLKPHLDRDLERYQKEIKRLISAEIVKRYYYQKGEMQQNLKDDETLEKALGILKDPDLYRKTLKPSPDKEKEKVAENRTTDRKRKIG